MSISGRPPRTSVELLPTSLLLRKFETGQGFFDLSSIVLDSGSRLKCSHTSGITPVCGYFGGEVLYPFPTSGHGTGHHESGG